MIDTDIVNLALSKLGLDPIRNITDPTKVAKNATLWFPLARDETLRLWPWRCAIKRSRLLTIAWAAATAYSLGDIIGVPTGTVTGAQNYFVCTQAGTSGATVPSSWPTTGTITDGGVKWAYTQTNRTPYANQYKVPTDCLKVLAINPDQSDPSPSAVYILEGTIVYTDEAADPVNGNPSIKYICQLPSEAAWDMNLVEVVALRLAMMLCAQGTGSPQLIPQLAQEYAGALKAAKAASSGQGYSGELEPQLWTEVGGMTQAQELLDRYGR